MWLKHRSRQPELMDAPGLDDAVHYEALRGLRRVNWWSRTATVLERAIVRHVNTASEATANRSDPIRILDIASGGGDMAIQLAKRLGHRGMNVQVEGCDISATAVQYATKQAQHAGLANVRFFEHNILDDQLAQNSYDIVTCTLFMHHLDEPEVLKLFRAINHTSSSLALIDDLNRSPLGYGLAWAGCRLLTRCRVVHVDGPLSVQGAFTATEASRLALQAGCHNVQITRHWPERFLLTWRQEE